MYVAEWCLRYGDGFKGMMNCVPKTYHWCSGLIDRSLLSRLMVSEGNIIEGHVSSGYSKKLALSENMSGGYWFAE